MAAARPVVIALLFAVACASNTLPTAPTPPSCTGNGKCDGNNHGSGGGSSQTADAFPANMSGALTAYTGSRADGDPTAESPYDAATGHANYGAGSAASPWFEDQTLSRADLVTRRTAVSAALWSALIAQAGDPRTVPVSWSAVTFVTPLATTTTTANGTSYRKQPFYFASPLYHATISGVVFIPATATAQHRAPAVIYNHYHGGEFFTGTNEVDNAVQQDWNFPGHGSWGDYLIDEGYLVFAIDTYGFNHRRIDAATRPLVVSNPDDVWDELGYTQQFAADGRSAFAVRTFEDIVAFRLLQQHPLVDSARISAMGMSMGCVRTWAMAALVGDQLAAVVALGTFPRWQQIAATGIQASALNLHFFTGQISDLQLDTESFLLAASTTHVMAIMGDSPDDPQDGQPHPNSPDAASPGWPAVFAYAQYVATTLGDKEFRPATQPGLGHDWSPMLADQAVAFLDEHNGGAATTPASCAGLDDGDYCGSDDVDGDPQTLYSCTGGLVTQSARCPAGCHVNSADLDDQCN